MNMHNRLKISKFVRGKCSAGITKYYRVFGWFVKYSVLSDFNEK